jgi:hypothetical protein
MSAGIFQDLLIMEVRCPICGKSTSYTDNPYRPFCSVLCKGKDLFRWVEEDYCISTPVDQGEACGGKHED